MSIIVEWNGKDLPEEIRSLPAGRYVLEPVEWVPALSPEEEAGLEEAIESLRRGKGVDLSEARSRVGRALRR